MAMDRGQRTSHNTGRKRTKRSDGTKPGRPNGTRRRKMVKKPRRK